MSFRWTSAAAAVGLCLVACGTSTGTNNPSAGGTVIIGVPNDASVTNPDISSDYPDSAVGTLVYEGMVISRLDGGVDPGLASTWDVSTDGLTFTFHLRPTNWTDGKPFEPALRSDAIEAGGKRIPFPDKHPGAYYDNWRIYARSSSDDKSPIVALLAAIDALRAARIPLGANLKVILEGEEEAGSTNLQRTLGLHKNLCQ